METSIHSSVVFSHQKEKVKATSTFWEKLEFNRIGFTVFVMAIVACAGGITAGLFVDGASQFDLTMVIAPTMFTLCMIMAVAPLRVIMAVGVLALLIDTMIILF